MKYTLPRRVAREVGGRGRSDSVEVAPMKNRTPSPGKVAASSVLPAMDASWPLDAPPLAAIVREYGPLVRGTARACGVRSADVPDCAQIVWGRLLTAVADRRADPRGKLGAWLIKTTTRVAMDLRAKSCTTREVLMPEGGLQSVANGCMVGDHVAEALDSEVLVCHVLETLPEPQRQMFVLAFLEEVPMETIIEQLDLSVSTAYARRDAARKAFAREWEAMKLGGAAAVAAFALFSVEELVAAWRASAITLEGIGVDFSQWSSEPVGPVSAGPESVARAANVAARAARRGASLLRGWQNVAGAALLVLVGPDVYPALRASLATASSPAVAVAMAEPSTVTVRDVHQPSAPLSQAKASSARPPEAPSRPPRSEIQTKLLRNARGLLDGHQPGKALALLARVTAPDLAETRDELRARALKEQAGATRP